MSEIEKMFLELLGHKLRLMINMHHNKTGNKPNVLSIPFPEAEIEGTKITFHYVHYKGSCAITADEKNMLYHYEALNEK